MRRGILNEQEFTRANNMAREQMSALQARRETLSSWITEQKQRMETQDNVPELITTFLGDSESMDPRLRKAHLQTILKAAHITRGNIELEFRV